MAIEWSSEKCVPPGPTSDVDARNREALIMCGSDLGAGDLTMETLEEWVVRWRLQELYLDAKPDAWFEGNQTLPDVLTRWLGLEVNAGQVSRSEWLERRVAGWIDQAEQEAAEVVATLRAERELDALVDRLCNSDE